MLEWILAGWQAVPSVVKWPTLVAFVAMALVTVYYIRTKHWEKLIRSAPNASRAELISQYLDGIRIDTSKMESGAKERLAQGLLRNRIDRLWITFLFLAFVCLLLFVLILVYMLTSMMQYRPEPIPGPGPEPKPEAFEGYINMLEQVSRDHASSTGGLIVGVSNDLNAFWVTNITGIDFPNLVENICRANPCLDCVSTDGTVTVDLSGELTELRDDSAGDEEGAELKQVCAEQ